MLVFSHMSYEKGQSELSTFAKTVYTFLQGTIDTIDMEAISGSDFSTLLDLKKTVDQIVAQGIERWRTGKMR